MKAKVMRANRFRNVLEYALQPQKRPEIIGGTTSAETARELSLEFSAVRRLRPTVPRPVWHCSLSLPPGEKLDRRKWKTVAQDFMAKMAFPTDTLWVAVRHGDRAHDHIHIVASRISLTGRVWYGRWEARQAIQTTQTLERVHGLTITPGLNKDPNRHRKSLSQREIERSLRTGKEPARLALQDLIDQVIDRPMTVLAFIERLEAAGVGVRPNVDETGALTGLSFQYEGIAIKASNLGKGYTWAALQRKGVIDDEDGDGAALNEIARRLEENHYPQRGGDPGSDDAVRRGDHSGARSAFPPESGDLRPDRRGTTATPAHIQGSRGGIAEDPKPGRRPSMEEHRHGHRSRLAVGRCLGDVPSCPISKGAENPVGPGRRNPPVNRPAQRAPRSRVRDSGRER